MAVGDHRSRAHQGLVSEGVADTLTAAKDGARNALQERFPDIARSIDSHDHTHVISSRLGWHTHPGGRDERTELRVFDERVAAMIAPGPGGRWQTWTLTDGTTRQGPLAADVGAAREMADGLAHGVLLDLAAYAPDRADRLVHDLATQVNTWDRVALVTVVGHRLTDTDRATLTTTTHPGHLAELMVAAGVLAPSTMLSVLHAEGVDAPTATGLVPVIGLPIPEAIRQLRDEWGADRLDSGVMLGASVDELRTAGCTPTEMLAVAPRETLRALDAREHTWMLVGPSLLEAGYTTAEAVAHLAAHAPTAETFAAGVVTIIDNPIDAFTYASRRAAAEDLTVLSERYGLTPSDTAAVLATAGIPADRAVEVLDARCEHDRTATADLTARYLGIGPERLDALLDHATLATVSVLLPSVDGTFGEVDQAISANSDYSNVERSRIETETEISAGIGVEL